MKEIPIACALSADAINAGRAGLLPGLAARSDGIDELANGVRLQFAPADGILADIAAVIDAERRCCPFLQFDLRVGQDGGPITLSLTGPPGAREFVLQLVQK